MFQINTPPPPCESTHAGRSVLLSQRGPNEDNVDSFVLGCRYGPASMGRHSDLVSTNHTTVVQTL